jgi:uncharacterized protein (DUF2236 family)
MAASRSGRPTVAQVCQASLFPPAPPRGAPGDPGLFGPDSEVWRVWREKVLLAGGPTALLLQVAHPLVAAGVAAHSDFHRDPFGRLQATTRTTLTIAFGDREQARVAAASVNAIHSGVRGRLPRAVGPFPAGTRYDATDPALDLWVHATLVDTVLRLYSLVIEPLGRDRRERFFQEFTRFGELFGVGPAYLPASYLELDRYVRAMNEHLAASLGEESGALARLILGPPMPLVLAPAVPALRVLTVGLLPGSLRRAFGLSWFPRHRAAFVVLVRLLRQAVRASPPGVRYWPHYHVAQERLAASLS